MKSAKEIAQMVLNLKPLIQYPDKVEEQHIGEAQAIEGLISECENVLRETQSVTNEGASTATLEDSREEAIAKKDFIEFVEYMIKQMRSDLATGERKIEWLISYLEMVADIEKRGKPRIYTSEEIDELFQSKTEQNKQNI